MLDELKEEGIVNKVGGRFKLSTLIQKRMVALNTGARPLVDLRDVRVVRHVKRPPRRPEGRDVADAPVGRPVGEKRGLVPSSRR